MFFRRSRPPETGHPFPTPTVQKMYPNDKTAQRAAARARTGDVAAACWMGAYHLEGERRDARMALIYLSDAAKTSQDARMLIAKGLMDGAHGPYGFSLLCSRLGLEMIGFGAQDQWVIDEVNAGSLTFGFLHAIGMVHSHREHEAVRLMAAQAHEHGSMLAMGGLGHCYREGKGVPRSVFEAYVWYNLAAATGLESAAVNRDRLAERMPAAQLGAAKEKAAQTWTDLVGKG